MAFSAAKKASSFLPFLAVLLRCCWGQTLDNIILGNEATVNALAVNALEAFKGRCSRITACSTHQAAEPFSGCAVFACGSLIGSATSLICTEDFGVVTLQANGCERNCTGGRQLDNVNSVVRTAEREVSSEVITEECWTRDLNMDFVANRVRDTQILRWQQIGTPTGFYRIYPGVPQQTCYAYDPRVRPWYVAATSGPKDVILVIDVSGSMSNFNRIGLARDAAITVINTLTNSDYVAVVLFNAEAFQLLLTDPAQTPGILIQATNENIVRLSERVATIQPSGNTNFEAAFETAFSIVDGATELTSNCQTAIIFLTDGIPTAGLTGTTQLEDRVRSLNRNPDGTLKAALFTFTLGNNVQETLPFSFACQNQGIFTHVNDGGNLREQMSQYYEYYATLRQSDSERVVWVEPYIDASGAGLLVTASRAVYDGSTTPPRLVGVVAVDTLVSDLKAAGLRAGVDFAGVIRSLAARNTCPSFSLRNLTEYELNTFRVTHGGRACSSDMGSEPVSTACPFGSLNRCFYEENRYSTSVATHQNEACCDGSELTECGAVQTLDSIILGNEATVNALAVNALEAFNGRCSRITACSSPQAAPFSGCAVFACGSLIGSATSLICTEDFGVVTLQADGCERNCTGGRQLENAYSVVRTTELAVSSEVITEECWTRDLNTYFVANRARDTQILRWQQIGTPTGFYRIYPGVPQQTCYAYDPRVRPWYVAATSGPKDVILVIDVSASMSNFNRIGLVRDAAITVINTLTNSDYVAVVLFNAEAFQLLLTDPAQTPGTLIQATNENIVRLSERVATIQPSGNTNFEAAFETAFSIVDGATELTSNCQTAIIFLTDGIPTAGLTGTTQLEERVRSLNRNPDGALKATLFTFTLGNNVQETLPFAFACQNQGIFTHVNDGGNLREQMSQYYEYYATLRQSDSERVVWVEPYIDASGAGLLVTASRAVYDGSTTPPRLVGVVAVDTLVSDLKAAGLRENIDFAGVIRSLAARNTCPPFSLGNLTESELNTFRVTHGGRACSSDMGSEPVSTACPFGSLNRCFYEENRYSTSVATYQNEACCVGSGLTECGAVHIAVSSGVLLLLGVLSFILIA